MKLSSLQSIFGYSHQKFVLTSSLQEEKIAPKQLESNQNLLGLIKNGTKLINLCLEEEKKSTKDGY